MGMVTFTFRAESTLEAQEQVFEAVHTWKGVVQAGRLHPSSPNQLVRRMAWLTVEDEANSDEIVERLKALAPVDSAGVAVERYL